MLKINLTFTLIALAVVLVVTPEPISPTHATLTWVPDPQTIWINVYDVPAVSVGIAQSVTGGITNTVTISATEGMTFVIQEYRLVNGRLELVKFFSTGATPHVDFPTATLTPVQTQIPQPTQTPKPTATATATPIKPTPIIPRIYISLIGG